MPARAQPAPAPLPPETREAILELARALARQAAREDHAEAEQRSKANDKPRRDLRAL